MKKLLLYGLTLFLWNSLFAQKAPIALNDTVVIAENSSSNIINVIANDTAYTGTSLTISITTGPLHGTASIINGNQVNYVPAAYYYGTDFFSYSVCDSINLCDTAIVFIDITGSNVPPVAQADSFILNDSSSTIFLAVTTNDFDPEHGPFKVTAVINNDTLLGSLSIDTSTGQVLFTRKPLACGTDSFQYIICDTFNACNTGTIWIVIDCPDNIFRPEGFSPNGDGKNDQLVFTNLEYFSPASLKVFNRWGNVVYQNDDYKNDWNGNNRLSNEALPDGTYFYILELPNKHKYNSYLIISRTKN